MFPVSPFYYKRKGGDGGVNLSDFTLVKGQKDLMKRALRMSRDTRLV
jgi:hypothetical protein